MSEPYRHDSRAAFRYRNFRLLLVSSFFAVVLERTMGVAIVWNSTTASVRPLTSGSSGSCKSSPAPLTWTDGPLLLFFACLSCLGIARAFQSPSTGALIAQFVPS